MVEKDSSNGDFDSLIDRRNLLKVIGIAGLTSTSASSIATAEGESSSNEFNIVEATVADIQSAIATGSMTAHAVTAKYLERIEAYDDELNSILTVNEDALNRADELDNEFATSGLVGPLHGIPIILKDNFDTDDLPTTAGSVSLEGSIPPDDAFLVKQLREAGGIILAKANMHEFAYGIYTVSSLGGQTSNAYALDRLPSGSSGGTAAAIAANLGAIGTGSDTCSSVRSPPAFNNQVGVRPTMGILSRDGIIPLSETQDTAGPMTRTVTDAAIMLNVMAGYDPSDPITAQSIENVPEKGYASYLNVDGLDGARIGIARQLFGIQGDSEDVPANDEDAMEVTNVVNTAIEDMSAAGATVIDPVEFDEALEYTSQSGATGFEFKRDLNNYLDSLGDDAPVESLEEIIKSDEYFPETFRLDEYEADELFGSIEDSLTSAQKVDVSTLDENIEYLQQLTNRVALKEAILATMADYEIDAILYPTSTIPPMKIGQEQPFSQMNCELSAYSGLPAITVPAGFTAVDELPVGVELLSRPFTESLLFELTYSYEQTTMHRKSPSKFGPLESDKAAK